MLKLSHSSEGSEEISANGADVTSLHYSGGGQHSARKMFLCTASEILGHELLLISEVEHAAIQIRYK